MKPSSSFPCKAAITSILSPKPPASSSSSYIPSPYFSFRKKIFDEVPSLIKDPCWFPLLKIEVGMVSVEQQAWAESQVSSIYVTWGNLLNF